MGEAVKERVGASAGEGTQGIERSFESVGLEHSNQDWYNIEH